MMNSVVEKVKAPAIGLMVVGVLNGVIGLLTLLGGLARLTGILGPEELPIDQAERTGFLVGTAFGYVAAFAGLIAAPVIFFGGFRMLKLTSFKFAKTAAILAIVPLTSCCFIAGIPLGVWALMVLNRPEISAAFDGGQQSGEIFPPPRY